MSENSGRSGQFPQCQCPMLWHVPQSTPRHERAAPPIPVVFWRMSEIQHEKQPKPKQRFSSQATQTHTHTRFYFSTNNTYNFLTTDKEVITVGQLWILGARHGVERSYG